MSGLLQAPDGHSRIAQSPGNKFDPVTWFAASATGLMGLLSSPGLADDDESSGRCRNVRRARLPFPRAERGELPLATTSAVTHYPHSGLEYSVQDFAV
jgi:hypothetical protein